MTTTKLNGMNQGLKVSKKREARSKQEADVVSERERERESESESESETEREHVRIFFLVGHLVFGCCIFEASLGVEGSLLRKIQTHNYERSTGRSL